MLRLTPEGPVETLWDALLPAEVRVLPEAWARLDELLSDPALLVPFQAHWQAHAVRATGRPTIPMAVYVRLMVVKHRTGWGYQSLVREVSDSLHLRRFCWIALHQRMPDESTLRKLTRRLGSELVDELIRGLIEKASRERRFRARAMRCDSTVVSADVRYPTDSGAMCGCGQEAGAGGQEAARGHSDSPAEGPRPEPGGGPAAAGVEPESQAAIRRGQAGGAKADRRSGRQAQGEPPRGTATRRRGQTPTLPRQGGLEDRSASSRHSARGDHRPGRARRRAGEKALHRREDPRPTGLLGRSRRPAGAPRKNGHDPTSSAM